MFTLHVVDCYFYVSLIYGEYLANVHFGDIPHTFIPHFTLHSAEKNPHRIFRKLPHDNFPHSAFRVPQNTPSLLQTSKILDSSENHVVSFSVSGILRELTGLRAGNKRVGVSTSRPVTDTCSTAPAATGEHTGIVYLFGPIKERSRSCSKLLKIHAVGI